MYILEIRKKGQHLKVKGKIKKGKVEVKRVRDMKRAKIRENG